MKPIATKLLVFALLSGAFCVQTQAQVSRDRGCSAKVIEWWRQHGSGGRIVCGSDPARPAILLVHGLHQDAQSWTAPSSLQFAYDYRKTPNEKRIGSTHNSGNSGFYAVTTSDVLTSKDRRGWDRSVNWFDYLAGLDYTVATWNEPGLTFSQAYPSVLEAFDSLLAHTAQRSPAQLPQVALIGHSRGGLLIRAVLKERPNTKRVQTVVTLHSPHQGSAVGQPPGRVLSEAMDLISCCLPADWTTAERQKAQFAVIEALKPFKLLWPDENRELAPDGPLIRSLRDNERPISGVKYYTFGGTNPEYFKTYLWLFDASSSSPQYNGTTQIFVWQVKPIEIGTLSPIMNALRDFADEVKPGKGDGVVTDASARLPFSIHQTTLLNHAEVLWDRPLQQKVAQLLTSARPPGPVKIR